MALVFSEEQQLLHDTAAGFFAEKAPISALRALRDARDETGYSPALWQEMADMGLAGVMVPEAEGGAGFGTVGAGIVAEAMGRHLSASPFLAHSVAAASVLQAVGAVDRLGDIAAGTPLYTLALDEGAKFDPLGIKLRAEANGAGYRLSGLKTFVPDGHVADRILVVARTSGAPGEAEGLSLF